MEKLIAEVSGQLIEARQDFVGASPSLYVLVDPILGDPLDGVPLQSIRAPLAFVHDGMPGEQRPYLLALREFGRDAAVEFCVRIAIHEALRINQESTSHKRTICAWVISDVPSMALARRLGRSAQLTIKGQRRLFRYWDPRVLDILDKLMTPSQIYDLVGPLDKWCWLGRDGHLKEWASGCDQTKISKHPSPILSEEQVARLLHSQHANLALDALQDAGVDLQHVSPAQLIADIVKGTKVWGLVTEQECVSYALYCALYGRDFDEWPPIRERMHAARLESESPIAALKNLSEEFWGAFEARQHVIV